MQPYSLAGTVTSVTPGQSLTIPDIDSEDDVMTAALKYAASGWYVGPCARLVAAIIEPMTDQWPTCKVDGCTNLTRRRTGMERMCPKHTSAARRNSDTSVRCSQPDCDGGHYAQGLCAKHYQRLKVNGDPGATRTPWRGSGRSVVQGGYIEVPADGTPGAKANGWMLEHRKVMADRLGRALLPEEKVHHLNGDRSDNRWDNLELWSTSQPPGQRVDDKVAWAMEMLRLYAPEALA